MKKPIFTVVAGLLVVFLGIQLVPVQRTNPAVLTQMNWDSPQTKSLAERACLDCHSNETIWPWYSYVAPVSWLVTQDVNRGRRELNFSDLSTNRFRSSRGINRLGEIILEGRMPPAQYLLTHPQAKLAPEEQQALVAGLQKTLSATLANQ
jgi:hypothetical protein